jgi:hypothetical protein
MKYSYEITPRPAELGSGWRLRLLEGNREVGGGVFPPVTADFEDPKEALQAAFDDAEAEAYEWLDAKERSERGEREHQVNQILANQRLEGLEPDQAQQRLLQAYIDGTATLDDLLEHARAFAYDHWLADQVQQAIDDPRPSIPHDQVMTQVRAIIERKRGANVILSPEFREGVSKAIQEAVARSKEGGSD